MACVIYGLVDPRTKMVRYVGQSSRGLERARVHGYASVLSAERGHKRNWIVGLRAVGLDYEAVLLQKVAEHDLDREEAWWIAYGRASGWPLTNLKDGGHSSRGFTQSEETRQKISERHRGKVLSPEHRAKIAEGLVRAATSRRPQALSREVLSPEERRARRSAAIRARWNDPAWKASVIAARVGKKHSAETRAKISAAQKGREFSPETREKMAAAIRGRHLSVEHRAKLSTATKGRPKSEETRARMRAAQQAIASVRRELMAQQTRDARGRIVKELHT